MVTAATSIPARAIASGDRRSTTSCGVPAGVDEGAVGASCPGTTAATVFGRGHPGHGLQGGDHLQCVPEREPRIRWHAKQSLQLEHGGLGSTYLELTIGAQPEDIRLRHVALEWWRRALIDPRHHEVSLPRGRVDRAIEHLELADGDEDLSVTGPDIRDKAPLAIGDGVSGNADCGVGHRFTAASPVQIQRPLSGEHRLRVGAAGLRSMLEDHAGVRPQAGLGAEAGGRVNLRAHHCEPGFAGQGPADRIGQRQPVDAVDELRRDGRGR